MTDQMRREIEAFHKRLEENYDVKPFTYVEKDDHVDYLVHDDLYFSTRLDGAFEEIKVLKVILREVVSSKLQRVLDGKDQK